MKKYFYFFQVFALLFSAVAVSTAAARERGNNIRAVIYRADDGAVSLALPNHQGFFAVRSDSLVTFQTLQNLFTGDILNAKGFIDVEKQIAHVHSVDNVGLKNLIGVWVNKIDLITFDIRNFNEVIISRYSADNVPESIDAKYLISPNTNGSWKLLTSEGMRVTLATMVINDDHFTLSYFSFDTKNDQRSQLQRFDKISGLK